MEVSPDEYWPSSRVPCTAGFAAAVFTSTMSRYAGIAFCGSHTGTIGIDHARAESRRHRMEMVSVRDDDVGRCILYSTAFNGPLSKNGFVMYSVACTEIYCLLLTVVDTSCRCYRYWFALSRQLSLQAITMGRTSLTRWQKSHKVRLMYVDFVRKKSGSNVAVRRYTYNSLFLDSTCFRPVWSTYMQEQ